MCPVDTGRRALGRKRGLRRESGGFEEHIPTGNAQAAARLPEGLAKLHTAAMFDWNDLKYFLAFHATAACWRRQRSRGSISQPCSDASPNSRAGSADNWWCAISPATGLPSRPGTAPLRRESGGGRNGFRARGCARDNGLSGTIRVTTTGGVADRLRKVPLIDAFHALRPDFRLELVISDRILDLSAGEADLAIRSGEPRDESLIGRKIAVCRGQSMRAGLTSNITERRNAWRTSAVTS